MLKTTSELNKKKHAINDTTIKMRKKDRIAGKQDFNLTLRSRKNTN